MDAQWIGVGLTAVVVTVSLAMFIRAGLAGIREDYVRLEGAITDRARQQREDYVRLERVIVRLEGRLTRLAGKLAETAERVARIEGILVRQWTPDLVVTPVQAVPGEAPETR